MLMGQTEQNAIKQSNEKTVFLEDLTPEERAKILKEKAGVSYIANVISRSSCPSD